MVFIQFRIHPSLGMARMGESQDWYFLGPEIPRFIQEQFPNLRHAPVPVRHPKAATSGSVAPEKGRYRDRAGKIMPQAARFRVFAYVYNTYQTGEYNPPFRVMELQRNHADIEWTVKLANEKTPRTDDPTKVDSNRPGNRVLATKAAIGVTDFKVGTRPNLGWAALEGSGSTRTGRLHVIGNENQFQGGPLVGNDEDRPYLYQDGCHDAAADGPVTATVIVKDDFTALFSDVKYLIPEVKDPTDLPSDKKVNALGAWVVVNVPDYVPDLGHIVSVWDLALNQAWKYIADGSAGSQFEKFAKDPDPDVSKLVEGLHHLALRKSEVNTYVFYDYYTHIHPQLCLFSDLPPVSGQVRAGSGDEPDNFIGGIEVRGTVPAEVPASAKEFKVARDEALRMKAASRGLKFLILLSRSEHPFSSSVREFVECSLVDNDGTLHVARAKESTGAVRWPSDTGYFAALPGAFIETKLTADANKSSPTIDVDLPSAAKMPEPTPAGGFSRDGSFRIALVSTSKIEWLECTGNDKATGKLAVTRGVDGTGAEDWSSGTVVVAEARGHKTLDARTNAAALATGLGGTFPKKLFDRLRLPKTVYGRDSFRRNADATTLETLFPREFGRRLQFDSVTDDDEYPDSVSVDPDGSLTRFHGLFPGMVRKACTGRAKKLLLDPAMKPKLLATDTQDHVDELDDQYWIVSERDMPMLAELALTDIQYNQFQYWATGKIDKKLFTRWGPLFEELFAGSSLETYFTESPPHSREDYIDELFRIRPRYAPAFLDMANMGRMLGGAFQPGIEVGREAGKPANWSLYHGGTSYFPDIRFQAQDRLKPHLPGMLTKDLAVPWFGDYLNCEEMFWPTSRPQIASNANGIPYLWLTLTHANTKDQDALKKYWTRLGFIRRLSDGRIIEDETTFQRP